MTREKSLRSGMWEETQSLKSYLLERLPTKSFSVPKKKKKEEDSLKCPEFLRKKVINIINI